MKIPHVSASYAARLASEDPLSSRYKACGSGWPQYTQNRLFHSRVESIAHHESPQHYELTTTCVPVLRGAPVAR
jgi:hypothetical protein